jgi:eukaryotic-like serine/threonine-protein kinase
MVGDYTSTPHVIRFGIFELDLHRGELRKRGIRLKLQEQSFRILTLLLAQPGELVSRERLRETLWPADTFVGFEHSLNAAIAKLRQTLGDTAENPKFIETVPRRGYRFIAPVDVNVAPEPRAAPADTPSSKQFKLGPRLLVASAVVIAVMVSIAVLVRPHQAADRVFIRLTSETGLITDPAVSPDGKFLAYASDRGGGHLHIWIQPLSSDGRAVQLTHGDVDEHQPAFSPDGTRIVFRSEANGGEIDTVSAIGGEPVRITGSGKDPRFSPDGKLVAYWAGREVGTLKGGFSSGAVYVVPSMGGLSTRISGGLAIAAKPVWAPDGRHVLVVGEKKLAAYGGEIHDWWVLPLAGGDPIPTAAYELFRRQGFGYTILQFMSSPTAWTPGGILFSAISGDSVDLWRVQMSTASWQVQGIPDRLTRGTGSVLSGSATNDGRVVFASVSHHMQLWALRMDTNRGRAEMGQEQVTDTAASEYWPSATADGRLVAFTSTRSGSEQTWLKNTSTGREWPLNGAIAEFPRLSFDGTMVAYTILEKGRADEEKPALYIAPANSGQGVKVSDTCGWAWGWSPDAKYILCKWGVARVIRLLDVKSRRVVDFLSEPGGNVYQGGFSPDGRWVVFMTDDAIYAAPFRGPNPVARRDWIKLTEGNKFEDKPRWSPDGNLLYFTSDRDGSRCLWAQRLDPSTKAPVGDPWAVHHFHAARRSILNTGSCLTELAVEPDRIVFPLDEITGNVWMVRPRT